MKNVTPRHPSLGRSRIGRLLFFFVGLLFAVWELRAFWHGLTDSLRKLRNRS